MLIYATCSLYSFPKQYHYDVLQILLQTHLLFAVLFTQHKRRDPKVCIEGTERCVHDGVPLKTGLVSFGLLLLRTPCLAPPRHTPRQPGNPPLT